MSFMSKPHAASSSRHAVHEGIVQLVEDGLECQERLGLVIGQCFLRLFVLRVFGAEILEDLADRAQTLRLLVDGTTRLNSSFSNKARPGTL